MIGAQLQDRLREVGFHCFVFFFLRRELAAYELADGRVQQTGELVTLGGEPLSLSLRGGRRSTRHKGSGGRRGKHGRPLWGQEGSQPWLLTSRGPGCSLVIRG